MHKIRADEFSIFVRPAWEIDSRMGTTHDEIGFYATMFQFWDIIKMKQLIIQLKSDHRLIYYIYTLFFSNRVVCRNVTTGFVDYNYNNNL